MLKLLAKPFNVVLHVSITYTTLQYSISKKSETQEQGLVNNLICPKNGCLSSTLTFVCYWGRGIKGVHCRLSVASFTEESPVFGFESSAHSDCGMYAQHCRLWFVSDLPVRLTFVCKVTDIFTEMNIVCVGHFTKSPSFRLKTYAFPVIECFQGYCDIWDSIFLSKSDGYLDILFLLPICIFSLVILNLFFNLIMEPEWGLA